ncbi:putative GTP-binding protein OBGM, mitochondrial isoform X1 [Senna tora]|uniref:Putative GTP-binding protein OBGM, mitochondrial isoform X1 n=1 Tax=Senna tora TaxID=362788 RepID=A0A834TR20_9FABA|nr:putative GTP-binding protein OBGM, mitochondrial isoform X1 [Senna tora]
MGCTASNRINNADAVVDPYCLICRIPTFPRIPIAINNAGKSTLLGAISKARPTVGHYAFTTLRPNLGNLNFDDLSITVADIPGLIKGAHQNRGLGHAFLRHIEHTKVLAYVVDLAAALDRRKGIPPWEQLKDLILELEYHQEGLSNRPSFVVANKIDEEGVEEVYEELQRRVQGVPIYPVCAVLEEGIPELKDGLKMLVNDKERERRDTDRQTQPSCEMIGYGETRKGAEKRRRRAASVNGESEISKSQIHLFSKSKCSTIPKACVLAKDKKEHEEDEEIEPTNSSKTRRQTAVMASRRRSEARLKPNALNDGNEKPSKGQRRRRCGF